MLCKYMCLCSQKGTNQIFFILYCCPKKKTNKTFLKNEIMETASFFRKERIPKIEEMIPMVVQKSIIQR